MKAKLILLLFALLLPLALFGWLATKEAPSFDMQQSSAPRMKHMLVGGVPISVEIAKSAAEQTRGLSGRASLPENTGLLFVFSEDAKHGIWMKGMQFPIDIGWANKDGTIVHLVHALSPDSYPRVFAPAEDALYVIELPAGFFGVHDIEVGDRLSFPLVF